MTFFKDHATEMILLHQEFLKEQDEKLKPIRERIAKFKELQKLKAEKLEWKSLPIGKVISETQDHSVEDRKCRLCGDEYLFIQNYYVTKSKRSHKLFDYNYKLELDEDKQCGLCWKCHKKWLFIWHTTKIPEGNKQDLFWRRDELRAKYRPLIDSILLSRMIKSFKK